MRNVPIFFAPNVHTGGGLVLLKGLLESWDANQPLCAFLDERARPLLSVAAAVNVHWVAPRIISRISAQRRLRAEASHGTTIISFNGLPPLLPTRGKVVVFQQNRLHLVAPAYRKYGPKVALRLALERFFGHALRHRVHRYLVQTPSMAQALERWYGKGRVPLPDIAIVPFVYDPPPKSGSNPIKMPPEWDFLYVADGLPHKNHRKLFEAWSLLAHEGLRPSLALTLPFGEKELLELIAHLRDTDSLNIINLGSLSHEDLLATYGKARALIYPSLTESFGLPLLEAQRSNLPIIAAELDYVRDVCRPVETFDPNSEVSIARAVRRFTGHAAKIEVSAGPSEFWQAALGINPRQP